jgi:hypothetical protein
MEDVRLPVYDPDDIPNVATVLVVGGGGSGKTSILQYLMFEIWNKRHLTAAVVFCSPEDKESYDTATLRSSLVKTRYDDDVVADVCKSQLPILRLPMSPSIIVCDEVLSGEYGMRSLKGRNKGVILLYGVAHLADFPTHLEQQVDVVIVFPEAYEHSQTALHKTVLSHVPQTDVAFAQALASLGTHEALAYDRQAHILGCSPYLSRCQVSLSHPCFHD